MKTMIVLAISLAASLSQAYTCTAIKNDGLQTYNTTMTPVADGPVVAGLVRVQLTQTGPVSFIVWEAGPMVDGVHSQHLFANIYDQSGSASEVAEVTLSKEGPALFLRFTSRMDKQNYFLVCAY